ncbi:hypothetical protein WICPIJ_008584 [Wickerhamomyces pijperi]|uniref:Uncharacterized protein n=1 Tax=Wickerhamomyces pijperi TaxID=599730 RepID=A0A9P8TI61_WICPI|nr:hypothetical protein WICPIJ_008584 [Wickerhamomyces pijperi]
MDLKISVVMTKQPASGLIVTSPVIKPTSLNSSNNSLYFWLDKALIGEHRFVSVDTRDSGVLERIQSERIRSGFVFSLVLPNWLVVPAWREGHLMSNLMGKLDLTFTSGGVLFDLGHQPAGGLDFSGGFDLSGISDNRNNLRSGLSVDQLLFHSDLLGLLFIRRRLSPLFAGGRVCVFNIDVFIVDFLDLGFSLILVCFFFFYRWV